VIVGPLDLAILGLYLIVTAAFGAWIGKGKRSAAQFMLGDRALPGWLVLASIVATETSTVTFLSIPGAAWKGNCTWIQLPIGYAVGRIVVILVLMPRYFRGEIVTAYQILHERFGGLTKLVASLLFVVTRTLADGLRLFLSAIVLQEIAQSRWASSRSSTPGPAG
jgi:SSS family solute:Na+ symporter